VSGPAFPDLTGRWLGRFDYPSDYPATSFEADLAEEAGLLAGQTEEPNSFRADMGPLLQAVIEGHRSGGAVRFVKRYLGFPQPDDPVYEGTADAALTRISGRWLFVGKPGWSGRFVMMRKPLAADRAMRRTGRAAPVEG
jgi:hypothetical protein